MRRTLTTAVETAKSADAKSPKAYKEAIAALSQSIAACVGSGLLPRTAKEAVAALEREASMNKELTAAIETATQSLRAAISTAENTRKSAPLAECLAKEIQTDDVLRDSCVDLINKAESLLEQLRREEVWWDGREHACTPHSCNHKHYTPTMKCTFNKCVAFCSVFRSYWKKSIGRWHAL